MASKSRFLAGRLFYDVPASVAVSSDAFVFGVAVPAFRASVNGVSLFRAGRSYGCFGRIAVFMCRLTFRFRFGSDDRFRIGLLSSRYTFRWIGESAACDTGDGISCYPSRCI